LSQLARIQRLEKLIGTPASYLQLNNINGYGTDASNKILRWTTLTTHRGLDIIYTSSTTAGDTFEATESGIYIGQLTRDHTGINTMGFSKNASSLTAIIYDLANAEIISGEVQEANSIGSAMFLDELQIGDIVRCHGDGGAIGPKNGKRVSMARLR